ncbi:MAG: hypothetical protein C4B59_08200 [Candidatus Methanogaster sp.]|uniref:Uncharacterized protein n=1 Tax=Candidatus Methanogaster sp. TaxID=3386292 RepID=A0AC61L2W9_9EURY|nr:MAG: hypothetical protein C4B59_08200 [ANME-2 cluster archaeon]
MKIKNGDVVQGSRWSEPVVVNLIEGMGDYIRVVGVTRNSRQHIDQLIHQDGISALGSGKIESNFTAEPGHVFLVWYIHYNPRTPFHTIFITNLTLHSTVVPRLSPHPKYASSHFSSASLLIPLSPSGTFIENNHNWGAFHLAEKDNIRDVEIAEVNKMLSCKDESRGFHIPVRTLWNYTNWKGSTHRLQLW